jgi:hypothetical protein
MQKYLQIFLNKAEKKDLLHASFKRSKLVSIFGMQTCKDILLVELTNEPLQKLKKMTPFDFHRLI